MSEDGFDVLDVAVKILAIDDDIIDVDQGDLPFELAEDSIHEALQDRGTRLESEGHSLVLVQTLVGSKGSLLLVFLVDLNLMKPFVGVERREVKLSGKLGKDIVDSGNWILIRFSDFVNLAIVNAKPIFPFLSDQNGWRGPRRF